MFCKKKEENLSSSMYSPYHPGTYVDFATDDNGLWAVFALSLNNHTAIISPPKK